MKHLKSKEQFNESNLVSNLKEDEISELLKDLDIDSLFSLAEDLLGYDEVEGSEWNDVKNDLDGDEIFDWIVSKYLKVGITKSELLDVIETYN
jgi:hypothetical protein